MTDPLQHALHTAAIHSSTLASLAAFCATTLLYILMVGMVVLGLVKIQAVTWALVARVVISGLAALLLTLVFKTFVDDPRPFVIEHYAPLAHATNDNGFPSDHTLVAALLAYWAWWLDRRWTTAFVIGAALVLLGRLAIGAHHTLDVAGSIVFAVFGAGVAAFIPFPETFKRVVLALPRR